jgi:hypothetical protein
VISIQGHSVSALVFQGPPVASDIAACRSLLRTSVLQLANQTCEGEDFAGARKSDESLQK